MIKNTLEFKEKLELTTLYIYLKKAWEKGIRIESNPICDSLNDWYIIDLIKDLEKYANKGIIKKLLND
jgi:hypothetical protein